MPPPGHCPICNTTVWSREETPNIFEGWDDYNNHLRHDHPEYERWNGRVFYFYAIPLLLFIAGPVGLGLAQGAFARGSILSPLGRLLVLLFWGLALAVFVAVLLVQQRGNTRFREQWNLEHVSRVS